MKKEKLNEERIWNYTTGKFHGALVFSFFHGTLVHFERDQIDDNYTSRDRGGPRGRDVRVSGRGVFV
jgi:hypothetical protein